MKKLLALCLLAVSVTSVHCQDSPPADSFRVLPRPAEGPTITPYLKYQTELAWHEDDQRRKRWEGIRTEDDLLKVQQELRTHLLNMIGGLPSKKTPLNAKITGTIQMKQFHIEKLIFESLPGVYVTALVYVPEDGNQKH